MPAQDIFMGYAPSLESPFVDGFDVIPNDAVDVPKVMRGLMVSTPGDVAVIFVDGGELVLPGLVPGQQYIGRIRRILSAGTTATGIKALI